MDSASARPLRGLCAEGAGRWVCIRAAKYRGVLLSGSPGPPTDWRSRKSKQRVSILKLAAVSSRAAWQVFLMKKNRCVPHPLVHMMSQTVVDGKF